VLDLMLKLIGHSSCFASGGQLIVDHHGKKITSDFTKAKSSLNPFKAHWTAFYADCEHEVVPLTEGYRLVLVYNLTYVGEANPILGQEIPTGVLKSIKEWEKEGALPISLSLEHDYTSTSLLSGSDNWKGKDKQLMHLLSSLTKASKLIAFAGHVRLDLNGNECEYQDEQWDATGAWLDMPELPIKLVVESMFSDMQVEDQLTMVDESQCPTGNEGTLL
jgi:hypothetical protein